MRFPVMRHLGAASALALATLLTATPAQAQLKTWAYGYGSAVAVAGSNSNVDNTQLPGYSPSLSPVSTASGAWNASSILVTTTARASSEAWGQSQAGVLKARTASSMAATLRPSHTEAATLAAAHMQVGYSDFATFGLAGYAAGTTVTVTGRMLASGALNHDYEGIPDWQFDIYSDFYGQIGSTKTRYEFYDYVNGTTWSGTPGEYRPSGYANGAFYVSATIVLGARTELGMGLHSYVWGNQTLVCDECGRTQYSWAELESDFSNTLKWDGFSSVRVNGQEVDPGLLRVTSESGFDYTNGATPVPEPATWALVGAGLLMLTAAARTRKQSLR